MKVEKCETRFDLPDRRCAASQSQFDSRLDRRERAPEPVSRKINSLPTQQGFIIDCTQQSDMPEIQVSDSLYRQLQDASNGRDMDEAMWEMVYLFQRGNNPSE